MCICSDLKIYSIKEESNFFSLEDKMVEQNYSTFFKAQTRWQTKKFHSFLMSSEMKKRVSSSLLQFGGF
jgi:hypothetical protein